MNVRRLGTKTQGHTLDTPTANLQPPFFVSSSLSGLSIQIGCPKVPDGLICMFLFMSNTSSYGEYTPPHIFGTACGAGETHLQAHPAKAVAAHGHTAQKGSDKGAEVWEIRCHGLRPDAEPLSGERHRPRFSSGSGRTMRALTKACLPQRFLLMAHLPGDDWREDSRERVPAMAPQLASCRQDAASMEWQQPQDASAPLEGIHLEAIKRLRITSNRRALASQRRRAAPPARWSSSWKATPRPSEPSAQTSGAPLPSQHAPLIGAVLRRTGACLGHGRRLQTEVLRISGARANRSRSVLRNPGTRTNCERDMLRDPGARTCCERGVLRDSGACMAFGGSDPSEHRGS